MGCSMLRLVGYSCRRAVGPSIGRSHRPARTLRTFRRRVLLRPSPVRPAISAARGWRRSRTSHHSTGRLAPRSHGVRPPASELDRGSAGTNPATGLNADERRGLQARANVELPARLRDLAAMHGLAVSRVTVRNQRTRWGSCGRNGHITLNWRLTLMPERARDYLMVHELMHLRRFDHSSHYWRLVAKAYPDHERARTWLRVHGPSLLLSGSWRK